MAQNQEIINIGATPNDQQGDPLRTAFTKVNNNFTQLFQASSVINTVYGSGGANIVLWEYEAATFATGEFDIYTIDQVTGNAQSVTIDASTNYFSTDVKFTAHSTLFHGDPITQYSMALVGPNIQLIANAISTNLLTHYIDSSIMQKTITQATLAIGLDGYPNSGYALATESDVWLTTEN